MSATESTDRFDLLPYIAILMCTLGTLLLVTLTMAVISLGPGAGEIWIPRADSTSIAGDPPPKALLIEWDGNVAVVHRGAVRQQVRLYLEDPVTDTADANGEVRKVDEELMESLLSELEEQSDSLYALFAVRPSGFNTFLRLRRVFDDRELRVGYEPVHQAKMVRMGESSRGQR